MKKVYKKQTGKGVLKGRKKIKCIVLGVGLVVCIGLSPFTRPLIAYPYYIVKCGFLLPIVGGLGVYDLPGQKYYTFYGFRYFCTEQEAREAGYVKNLLGE